MGNVQFKTLTKTERTGLIKNSLHNDDSATYLNKFFRYTAEC